MKMVVIKWTARRRIGGTDHVGTWRRGRHLQRVQVGEVGGTPPRFYASLQGHAWGTLGPGGRVEPPGVMSYTKTLTAAKARAQLYAQSNAGEKNMAACNRKSRRATRGCRAGTFPPRVVAESTVPSKAILRLLDTGYLEIDLDSAGIGGLHQGRYHGMGSVNAEAAAQIAGRIEGARVVGVWPHGGGKLTILLGR